MIIEVQTTQNVTIDYETANIGHRLLAYIIDILVIILWIIGWTWLIFTSFEIGFDNIFSGEIFAIFMIMLFYFPILFYDLLFEIFNNGQSPGKMVLKIRVVNIDGTRPSSSSFLIRWLFRLVDFTITNGFLAIIMIAVTKKSQRLGDMLAGTAVISLRLNSRNRELSITDLNYHENYKVTYADVLDRLSDNDIQTICSIIEDKRMQENDYFSNRLTQRIKSITGYNYEGPDRAFLKKIVSDYNYLALQE